VLAGLQVKIFLRLDVSLAGLALYANALSAETQRRLGPLPLGRPDQDLASMPLYQGRNLPGAEPDQRAS